MPQEAALCLTHVSQMWTEPSLGTTTEANLESELVYLVSSPS
jgi:hypothetical protein